MCDHQRLQLGKPQRFVSGGERQRPVRDRSSQRESAGSPSEQRFDQRKLQDILQSGRVCSGLHEPSPLLVARLILPWERPQSYRCYLWIYVLVSTLLLGTRQVVPILYRRQPEGEGS